MSNGNNDIEELEELLSELEGQETQGISQYSEDEDAVTQLMEAPLSDQEWMVQVTALDRRMMATDQLLSEFNAGKLSDKTLVWRGGMDDWTPLKKVEELSNPEMALAATATVTVANAAPPAPAVSAPAWSSPQASLPRAAPPPPAVSSPRAAMPAPSVVSSPRPVAPVAPVAVTQPVPAPQTYTARPVAVDFSGSASADDAGGMLQSKRAILSLGSVAMVAVIAIGYSLSSGAAPGTSPAASATPIAEAQTPTAAAKEEAEPVAAEPVAEEPEVAETQTEPVKAVEPDEKTANLDEVDSGDEEQASEDSAKAPTAKKKWNRKRSRSKRRKRKTRNKRSRKSATRASAAKQESAEEPAKPAKQETLAQAITRAGGGDPEEAEQEVEVEAAPAKPTIARSSSTFDASAAKSVLDEAASQASNCQPPGGPRGKGRVRVKYSNSGSVASVSILTKSFKKTTTGSCVRLLFRRARVPKFKGEPVVLTKSFTIP